MDWQVKLEKFLKDFEYVDDMQGVLVCGSYITGNPTSHSDLDVHIILKDTCNYRVKMNRVVDGLLIECFVNPPQQIRQYFEKDNKRIEQSSMNQFATGKIVIDNNGVVLALKQEAKELIEKKFKDTQYNLSELDKYGLWDMLDDLEDGYKQRRKDFDFIYYNYLNAALKILCKLEKYPYGMKIIYKGQFDIITKQKYSLQDFLNIEISKIITKSIQSKTRKQKLNCFTSICNHIWQKTGGFNIETFTFQSKLDI